jgi:hypothetical protein
MAAASIAGMPYPPGNSGNVLPELTREQRRKGGLARAEQRRKQLREQRERADEAFMQVVREQAAPIAAALVEEILDNPLGHANRVPAIREANLRLLGRPETTGTSPAIPTSPSASWSSQSRAAGESSWRTSRRRMPQPCARDVPHVWRSSQKARRERPRH